MKRFGLPCLAILACGATACTSTLVHYYTLQAPPKSSVNVNGAPAAFRIDVLPIGIPAQLDQSSLVIREGDSAVAVLDAERWASPYGDELRNALAFDLEHQLGTINVAGLPSSKDTPVLRVKVQVRRLDAWLGQQVQLDADWNLGFVDEIGHSPLTCQGSFSAPVTTSYPALVSAQRGLVNALASRIAADARELARSRNASCSINPPGTTGLGP
jgi:uncharacterized lipoprotein YmbA